MRVGALLLLTWGCGGDVAPGVAGDASSTSDMGAAILDAPSDRTTVGASNDGPSVEGSGDAGADAESGVCTISASNYDQSCSVDTDCWVVFSGDYCSAATCRCANSAVNVAARERFNAAVSKTPFGSGAVGSPCFCRFFTSCCSQGTCHSDC